MVGPKKLDKLQKCVVFLPEKKSVAFRDGDTVLDLALANRLGLPTSCGGMGTCGTCRVLVESDLSKIPALNQVEQEIAADRGFKKNERLGCQLEAFDGLCVRIPEE